MFSHTINGKSLSKIILATLLVFSLMPMLPTSAFAWGDQSPNRKAEKTFMDSSGTTNVRLEMAADDAGEAHSQSADGEAGLSVAEETVKDDTAGVASEPTFENSQLLIIGLDDEKTEAFGGMENLRIQFEVFLNEEQLIQGVSVVTLKECVEEDDGICGIFVLDDRDSTQIKLAYIAGEYSVNRHFPEPLGSESEEAVGSSADQAQAPETSEEVLNVDGTEAEAELVARGDNAGEGVFYMDRPESSGISLLGSGGTPPAKIEGRFVLDSGFTTNAWSQPLFPGTVSIYGHNVVSWGTDDQGSNRCMACISPQAANWGDPRNGNNREGQVYASFAWSDTQAGIAWYRVDNVRPDLQPAVGTTGIQYLGNAWIALSWSFNGYLRIDKTAMNPDFVRGNNAYSMSGIQYGVYGSHSDAANQTNAINSIILNESFDEAGNPTAFGDVVLAPGTYYVREIGGGVGYQIDQTIYTANVNETGYDWFYDGHGVENLYLQDKPLGDPVKMVVQKLDSTTGEAYGEDDFGGLGLAGAQFTIRYYNAFFDSVDSAVASGEPTKTWIVETRANGIAMFYEDYHVAGSEPLYYDMITGDPTIPFGTVLIQETKAPDGYLLPGPNQIDLQRIEYDPLTTITRLNPIIVLEEPHVLSFEKIDAETREPLGGAEFTLYRETSAGANTWEEVVTKTTDEQGRFTYSPIAVGSYKLVEIKAPQGYQSPAESGLPTEHRFTIDESTTTKSVKATNYKKPDISVQKTDKDTHVPVADTEFTIYSYPVALKSGAVTSDVTAIKADDPAWREVARIVTDKDGKATFANLPFGYYQLKETKAHPNYADYEESGGAPRFVKLDKYSTNETQVFENMAIQVAVEVYKKTIAITSSGLDGTGQQAGNNVGTEEYLYHFGARSNSNVWVDEFIITDDLSYVTTKGYRMTTLWTGTSPADMDFDNKMAVLYKTNMTSADERVVFKSNPLAANPHNPNNPNKNMTFSNTPGWRIWAEGLSTTHQTRLDVSDLALNDGEYITGLKIVYGGVAKEFFSGRGWLEEEDPHTVKTLAGSTIAAPIEHWSYSVVATEGLLPVDEFGDETIMKGTVTADLARNDGVLKDNDNDAVETRVIEPFYFPTRSNGIVGVPPLVSGFPSTTPYVKAGTGLPETGQTVLPFVAMAALGIAGTGMLLAGRRRGREVD